MKGRSVFFFHGQCRAAVVAGDSKWRLKATRTAQESNPAGERPTKKSQSDILQDCACRFDIRVGWGRRNNCLDPLKWPWFARRRPWRSASSGTKAPLASITRSKTKGRVRVSSQIRLLVGATAKALSASRWGGHLVRKNTHRAGGFSVFLLK